MEHSVDMAEGRVPFGHDGFHRRNNKVPFYVRSFSENVAWNTGHEDPVECAVQGMIDSDDQRKKILANNNLCAIAVFEREGKYYFT